MLFTFILPGLLSTVLQIPPTVTNTITASATPTTTSTNTASSAPTTINTSCTIITTTFPTTLPGVSVALPTGPRYYFQCGTSVVAIDLAASGTSTLTYPALSNNASLPSGYTAIDASNGQAVVTSTSSTTLATTTSVSAVLTTPTSSSATASAPSATVTHSGEVGRYSLPKSSMGLVVAVAVFVWAAL